MLRVLTMIVAIVIVAACTAKVKPPEAEVSVPGVKVQVGDTHDQGKFCPPGQAKKGRC